MKSKPDIYYSHDQLVTWAAYVKQDDGKAVKVKIGKFLCAQWVDARNAANKRFGADKVVLVEPN